MPEAVHASPRNEADAERISVASALALPLAASLYAAARLARLTASCLWFDEIFGVHAARHTWGGMLRFVAADLIHPPLFYALLKVWIGIGGDSLLWLRLLPALISIACVVPFILLCRALGLSRRETALGLLLLAASGYLIKYAQEVRMYSLLLLFTLISLWLFTRFVNDARARAGRLLLAIFAVNLLLVYTHYYGWLVVAAEAAYLLVFAREKFLRFAVVAAGLALCFAPWAYAVWQAAREGAALEQNLGWAQRPRLMDAAQFLLLVNEPFYFRQSSAESAYTLLAVPLGLLLFAAPLAALLWRSFAPKSRDNKSAAPHDQSTARYDQNAARPEEDGAGREEDGAGRRRDEQAARDGARRGALRWLLFFTLLPLAAAFLASRVMPQSVWGARHLIIVAAPCLTLSALGLSRLRPDWLRSAALLALGCWLFVAALVSMTRRDPPYIWCAWEGFAARLTREETPAADSNDARVTLYALEDLVAYHLWFALDTARERRFRVAVVKHLPGTTEDPAYFLPRRFDGVATLDASQAFKETQFWLAFRDTELSQGREPLATLKQRGYHMAQIHQSGIPGQRAFLILFRRD